MLFVWIDFHRKYTYHRTGNSNILLSFMLLNTFCGLTHIKREITNINYQIKTNLSRFLETKQKSKRFCQLNMKNVIAVHGKL